MTLTRHLLWGGILRAVLQLLHASSWFDLFPGITTPVTDLRQIHEASWLMQNGFSPYHSTLVHTPPLSLMVLNALSSFPFLMELAAIAADICSCVLINKITGGSWRNPTTCSLLFIWTPFSVLPCVATSLSSFSSTWVLLTVHAAMCGQCHLVAWGLAVATYLDLHPVLLLVPLMLLLKNGPEDLSPNITLKPVPVSSLSRTGPNNHMDASDEAQASPAQGAKPPADQLKSVPSAGAVGVHRPPGSLKEDSIPGDGKSLRTAGTGSTGGVGSTGMCIAFVAQYLGWLLALLLLSEVRMRPYPQNQCIAPWLKLVGERMADTHDTTSSGSCWMLRSYWDVINVADLTPNIGLFWYFFLEIFTAFRGFFILVFHSQVLSLVTPLAIRFGHRPVLLLIIFLLYIATFKPYPSMSDLALYQSFLPLLHPQFKLSKVVLPMAVLFAVLVVLIPAMWWQWLVVESANANFFYSVTLLLGAFHVLFQAHVLNCTVKLDRLVAGKPVAGYTVVKND